jgi:hypothetical protein
MRIIEQHKLIQGLRDFVAKMDRKDRDDFEMYAKRDKDDEELDNIAYQKLEQMHAKYAVRKTNKDFAAFFKKHSEQFKKDQEQ